MYLLEEVYLEDYDSPREAYYGLSTYHHFYNHERPHQSLDDAILAEIYFDGLLPNTNNGGKRSLASANILS